MKKHRTLKITEAWLREQGACAPAISELRPFLPLRISTDPEKNIKVLERIGEMYGYERERYADDPAFLGWWLADRLHHSEDYERVLVDTRYSEDDIPLDARLYVGAQFLAWAVDWYFTARFK